MISLTEQNSLCELIPLEQTIYTKPYGFGSSPTADKCEDLKLTCLYDENITQTNSLKPKWYELAVKSTLFNVLKVPIDKDKMKQIWTKQDVFF